MSGLSTEVKAKETHEKAVGYFKVSEQYGYKFIMEVKKIRDDRYYKDLGYSSFDDYCQEAWGVDRKYISERISMAEKYSEEEFVGYNRQLGHRKSLLLSRMSQEQREQATEKGIPTEQGDKSIDKATQKEINAYKKSAEDAKKQVQQVEQEKQQLHQRLEEERNKPPKTVQVEKEIVKEVVPGDVKQQLEDFKAWKQTYTLTQEQEGVLLEEIDDLKDKLKTQYEQQSQKENKLEELKQQEEELKHKAHISMFDFQLKVNNFIKDASPDVFLQGAMAYADDSVKKEMLETARALEDMTHTLKRILNEEGKYSDMQDAEIIDI